MNPVNRIFCIGKNYADHVAELAHLGHAPDGECVIFLKPPSAIVDEGTPIELPKGRGSIHHEAELVVQLTGGGRDIPHREAMDYVAGITLGLDLTLRDPQTELKNKGKPWELAKAFDGAAPLGDFRSEEHTSELQSLMRISYAVFCLKKKTNIKKENKK